MNLSTYSCNMEGLYFLRLLFYPEIQIEFLPEIPTSYNILELNVYNWLVGVGFRKYSEVIFYMGLVDLLWKKGFVIPLRTWSNGVGVML